MAQPNLDFLPLLPTTPVLPSAAAPRRALGSLRPCSARLAAAFGRVAEFVLHRGHRDITRVTLAGADCDARRCLCTAARALHLALSRDTLPFPVHPPFLHRRPLPAYGFDSRPRRISHRRCPFFPSFFLSFLPSFSRVSLRVSLLPRPTVLSVYRAGVGSAARLALSFSLSLFLGYTGCAFLFPPRKLFDALTRPPPVTMRILLLDRSSLEGFHGIRRWKNRSFGGWGRSIDEKGKEATRSIVKHVLRNASGRAVLSRG